MINIRSRDSSEKSISKSNIINTAAVIMAILLIFSSLLTVRVLKNGEIAGTLLLLGSYLVLLISEVIPVSLSSLLVVGLMPVTGITKDLNTAISGFSNQVVLFILASFGIAQALIEVPVSKRLLRRIIRSSGDDGRKVVLAFMLCTAAVSSIISNVPTCAVFLSIAVEFLNMFEGKEKSNNGRILMIAIPIASMIGGMITPAGSSVNILALSILEEHTGQRISFVQWMCIGAPAAFILVIAAWFLLVHIYHPTQIKMKDTETFWEKLNIPVSIEEKEKKVIVILLVSFILMMLSSWITSISVMVVALFACTFLCLPRIGVLDIRKLFKDINWDSIFLVGTVLSFSVIMNNNGVADVLANHFPNIGNVPVLVYLLCIAMLMFASLVIIPVAPSLTALILPVILRNAEINGVSVLLVTIVSTACIVNCYLFPLDTVCLLSYGHGYYKMLDMTKITFPLQISAVVIITLISYTGGIIFGWK